MNKSKIMFLLSMLLAALMLSAFTSPQDAPAQEDAPQAQETAQPENAIGNPEDPLDNGSGTVGAGLATALVGIIFIVFLWRTFARADDGDEQT